MQESRKITNALISVFYKDGLDVLAKTLNNLGVNIYSTGGTQEFIENLGIKVNRVEDLTSYPSILGGRVKTLHPKVFGGILARRSNEQDQKEVVDFEIPFFDIVVVDLYPFEETVKSTTDESKIIEKIDIGGVSLIRAAAKNFNDVLIVCDKADFASVADTLALQNGTTTIEQRRHYATKSFHTTSHYDGLIFNYFDKETTTGFKASVAPAKTLRYGENPHQKGLYYGNLNELFTQLHGKELSYNNLLDVDAALSLINDFSEPTIAIIKHNNPCGLATRATILQAYTDALAADPTSAFGGIIASNKPIDEATALQIDKLFMEVLIAPAFEGKALEILQSKKNRILLVQNGKIPAGKQFRSILNGVLEQDKDLVILKSTDLKLVTTKAAAENQITDMLFADIIVKHTKSNTIVLAKNKQLIGIGCGQTSRIDALKGAINKAKEFGFELNGAVMASDAFFPFPDCVEIAGLEGIDAVIQPGGSIKDELSVNYCNANNMAMYFTGIRHFKH
ncbi:MAG: bifunctional phosphoribosylaminoimidazolecarboxamide formyltransferase/IMP cyclohydrolase [Bacteroidia bacterium]|nr:bifunctional phosphoribosylaminoimidazolecarboxamide formyltransferase/IMP cyclohydrolase [Bacteroidia bacterium]